MPGFGDERWFAGDLRALASGRRFELDGSGGNQDRSLSAAAILAPPECSISNPGPFACNTSNVHVGPDGADLTIDVATSPGPANRVVVISSGIHGVEGFFGSAVQLALLERRPAPGVRWVLIHALNPYGFAWSRRFDATATRCAASSRSMLP